MGIHAIKLPDVGEGITEAELVEWLVAVGDPVRVDDIVAVVMTDKASVELPTPVEGTVTWLGGEIGDTLPVGSDLIRIEVGGEGNVANEHPTREKISHPAVAAADLTNSKDDHVAVEDRRTDRNEPHARVIQEPTVPRERLAPPRRIGEKPLAPPSVRKKAREAGIDLRMIAGSGPAGRITHEDLAAYVGAAGKRPTTRPVGRPKDTSTRAVKVTGLRRRIADKMVLAKAKIPHITIIEDVDVTHLEDLRSELNAASGEGWPRLTQLPFLIKAIVEAVREQPSLNAHFDDKAELITEYGGVHVGIATHTSAGLMVPVIHHAETHTLWDSATEIVRLAQAARDGSASREDLTGSTITITSLGSLGAIATTPIINHPEVAIVGTNKIQVRPHWDGREFVPRTMMNLSCSFDHRVIDGYIAAQFVAKLKSLLERPAMLFVERWYG